MPQAGVSLSRQNRSALKSHMFCIFATIVNFLWNISFFVVMLLYVIVLSFSCCCCCLRSVSVMSMLLEAMSYFNTGIKIKTTARGGGGGDKNIYEYIKLLLTYKNS